MPSLAVSPRNIPLARLGAGEDVAALLGLAIVALTAIQQATLGINPDTSWLITVSERVLAGDRLYVDVFELNPPASVLLTMPALALSTLLPFRPEALLVAMVIALAIGSTRLFLRALHRAGLLTAEAAPWLRLATLFSLLLLVGFNFAQREHVALIACLPWLGLMAVRASGAVPDRSLLLLAGLGAGLTAAIKPHFLLVLLLPLAAAAWRRRSPACLIAPETVVLGLVLLAYLLGTFAFTPEFWTVAVPLVSDGYLQHRQPLFELLTSVPALLSLTALGAAATIGGRSLVRGPVLMPLLGALAFEAAVLVQAKGFSNHQYPVLALGLVALGLALAAKAERGREARIGLLLWLVLAGGGALAASRMYLYPEVAALIRQQAPPRPTMIMAGSNLTVAHPLTRWVDGRWVGTRASLWASYAARELLAGDPPEPRRTKLRAQLTEDRRLFLADVARERPDVILVWEQEGPLGMEPGTDLVAALGPYRLAGSAQGVKVLVRSGSAEARRAPSG